MRIAVLAPHPDDETLGCGGALLRHRHEGDETYWIIGTGITKEYGFDKELIEKRDKEIEEVANAFQFQDVLRLNLPTTRVDEISMSDLISRISAVFNKIQPEILYLPFKFDIHSDHRKLFDAAFSCTKTFRYPSIKKILMMETISETDFAPALSQSAFVPNVFVNISEFIDKKIEIMKIFASEIKKHPFPRNEQTMRSLAMLRGAQSGVDFAEGFMLLKEMY